MAILREEDLEFTFFRSSGPGGQKKNKTDSSVRLRHVPTGLVVIAQRGRSQHQNKQLAMAQLLRRLERLEEKQEPRVPTRPSRAARRLRITEKKARGAVKRLRGRVSGDE